MTEGKLVIVQFLNHYLSLATLLGGVIVVLWFGALIYEWSTKKETKILSTLTPYLLPLGFLSTLGATLVSLYYSDYLGVLPCGLCWFQRVFIYSQVFLFALAWKKNDTNIFSYSLVLSTVGMVVALYHHYLQMGYSELIPCPAIASTIDCAKPTFVEYGFITFPFMSVVLFAFLITLSLHLCRRK
jgi:disulfide bond formation protein DsbB